MGKIGLIIEREYLSRVNKKSFIIMTLVTPLIMIAMMGLPAILAGIKDSEKKSIAVVDNSKLYDNVLKSNNEFDFIYAPDAMASTVNMSPGDGYYAIIVIDNNLIEKPDAISIFSEKTIPSSLKNEVCIQMNPWLSERKIENYEIPELKDIIKESSVNININTIKWDKDGSETSSSAEAASLIGLLSTTLIYMFIFAYGTMIINSVIQEKTNRIVEIMVSSVKPFELMMGKIIAVAFVGLTQFMIWILLIFGAMATFSIVSGMIAGPKELLEMNPMMAAQGMETLPAGIDDSAIMSKVTQMLAGINFAQIVIMFIVYFIGGYLFYASIFAAIGSLVDQEADSQQFMIPVMLINIFSLYAGIYSVSNPDGPLAVWCSMIPLTSPVVMMVRLPYDVPFWQLATSVVLLYATAMITIKFAAKIYRTGILMYGKKITYKEVIKWFRYKY